MDQVKGHPKETTLFSFPCTEIQSCCQILVKEIQSEMCDIIEKSSQEASTMFFLPVFTRCIPFPCFLNLNAILECKNESHRLEKADQKRVRAFENKAEQSRPLDCIAPNFYVRGKQILILLQINVILCFLHMHLKLTSVHKYYCYQSRLMLCHSLYFTSILLNSILLLFLLITSFLTSVF